MTSRQFLMPAALLVCAASLAACGESKSGAKGDSSAATVAAASKRQTSKGDLPVSKTVVWTPLIDTKMSQWRAWKADTMSAGWTVTDSTLSKDGLVTDLESRAQYANFELEFDWKIGTMGNSGVFYRVTEEYDKPYWSAPEYQLRDEAMDPRAENLLLASGSAYAVIAPASAPTKPLGEWNSARIVVAGNFVEHWLNGQQVVQYQLNSPEWTAKVKTTKFHEYPNYGLARRGFISIQGDHPGSLSIRAMRIRELP
jgi:predicted small secreted protein